ncbi:MAG: general secretion pathway protein GspK [Hyphomicrobium sp.]|nr:MAG: general secretion pathway protein GspK [Hyphomicrobium sp.]
MRLRRDSESGFALVIVIWGLLLVAVLATAFSVAMRTYTQATANLVENARAAAYADAGVAIAVAALLDRRKTNSGWRGRLRLDGMPLGCSIGSEARLEIAVQDEAGRIDINFADERLLVALFQSAGASQGESQAYVDRLVDFRDGDNLRRAAGAELAEYRSAGLTYGPKNSEFSSIDELEQVLGVPTDLFRSVRPYITVHSRLPGIDVSVAPRPLLRALAGDGLDGSDSVDRGQAPPVSQLRPDLSLLTTLGVRSSGRIFSIVAIASTAGGARFVREAVVELTDQQQAPFQFKTWQRGDAPREQPLAGADPLPRC